MEPELGEEDVIINKYSCPLVVSANEKARFESNFSRRKDQT